MTVVGELETANDSEARSVRTTEVGPYPALASTRIVTMSVSWYCWWWTEEARWRSSLSETSRSGASSLPSPMTAILVLQVLLAGRGDELQHRAAGFLVRGEQQAPLAPRLAGLLLFFLVVAQQSQDRLLGGGIQSVRHRLAPAAARRRRTAGTP